jgi:hypothetical protein
MTAWSAETEARHDDCRPAIARALPGLEIVRR